MIRFFKKMLLLSVCFYALLAGLQWMVDSGLRKSRGDDYGDWNRLFANKIKEPMIILGSSRAQAHFDTKIIAKKTGWLSYNLGWPGASLECQKIIWNCYLSDNHPKIVIQNIDLHALTEKGLTDKKQVLPYYNRPEVYNYLKTVDEAAVFEKWIPMSKYRNFENLVLKGLLAFFGKDFSGKKVNGYLCHHERWNSDFEAYKNALHGKPVDYSNTDFEKGFADLRELISDCKKRKIQLILVWTPAYYELTQLQQPTFSKVKNEVQKIAVTNNIPFWDYSKSEINHDKKYFYNSFHMNTEGVAVFCSQFADSLNAYRPSLKP